MLTNLIIRHKPNVKVCARAGPYGPSCRAAGAVASGRSSEVFGRSRLAAATDSDLGGSTSTLGAARDTAQVPKNRGSEMARRSSPGASKDVEREMRKFKRGTLKSGKGGKGGKVKSRRQAIAIGLSEARREGKRVPPPPAGRPPKTPPPQAPNKAPPT